MAREDGSLATSRSNRDAALALRRARITAACDGDYAAGCVFNALAPSSHETYEGVSPGDCRSGVGRVHATAASALLDGFSVAQITRAGG